MTRFEQMKKLLDTKKYFKLVCGAGNEDAGQVEKLAFIYTLAGAKGFDVSANVDVVKKAVEGIAKAAEYAPQLGRKISIRPFITVSIGMKGDPHVRKAVMNDNCVKCGACLPACPVDAITEALTIIEQKCIGCGACDTICRFKAISFYHKNKNLKSLLNECKQAGAENIELHAAVPDDSTILDEWKMVNEIITDNFVSMCLDRLHLSNFKVVDRITSAKKIAGDKIIIQADGVPMSGGSDDFNTTLQTVAIADIVNKAKLDVKILLSGGTNSRTVKLANMCGVDYHGVAIGTFARNIIKEYIENKNFWTDNAVIESAVRKASELVSVSIGEIPW